MAPPAQPPAEPPTAPLRLERIITPEQERQMNAAMDQNLASAETSLRAIATRRLSKGQAAVIAQVQSFIKQATDARKTDLAAASSLAQRASILAKDLAGKMR